MKQISLLPLVCYAAVLCYACYAASLLGHWPYYAHPDPKELPGPSFVTIAGLVVLLGLLSVIVLPFGYGIYRAIAAWKKHPVTSQTKPVLLYCAGAALWVLDVAPEFMRLPWSSLASWVMD